MVVTVAPSKSQINNTSKLEAMCMPEMIVSANTYPAVINNALQKQPHDIMYTSNSAFLCNATQKNEIFLAYQYVCAGQVVDSKQYRADLQGLCPT